MFFKLKISPLSKTLGTEQKCDRLFALSFFFAKITYYLKKAEDAFSQIASITKGTVFPFDANSPEVVASLLLFPCYSRSLAASRDRQSVKYYRP